MDIVKNQITPTIKEQIIQVRDTADANMLDCNAVQSVANREGWCELADYLHDRKNWKTYCHFIVTGKTGMEEEK